MRRAARALVRAAKNVPQQPATIGQAPTLGTEEKPVNGQYAGPNAEGSLNDVPPQFGLGPAPLVAVTGKEPPTLGTGAPGSPKTKG